MMFTLCAECAKEQNLTECKHTEEQLILKGTWATPEIYYAVEKGYKLVKIYEVWHYRSCDWALQNLHRFFSQD